MFVDICSDDTKRHLFEIAHAQNKWCLATRTGAYVTPGHLATLHKDVLDVAPCAQSMPAAQLIVYYLDYLLA